MKFDKKSLLVIRNIHDFFCLLIGPLVAACGVVLFYVPAKVTSGGASGIANILYNLFGFDVGTTSFCINLPLIEPQMQTPI